MHAPVVLERWICGTDTHDETTARPQRAVPIRDRSRHVERRQVVEDTDGNDLIHRVARQHHPAGRMSRLGMRVTRSDRNVHVIRQHVGFCSDLYGTSAHVSELVDAEPTMGFGGKAVDELRQRPPMKGLTARDHPDPVPRGETETDTRVTHYLELGES